MNKSSVTTDRHFMCHVATISKHSGNSCHHITPRVLTIEASNGVPYCLYTAGFKLNLQYSITSDAGFKSKQKQGESTRLLKWTDDVQLKSSMSSPQCFTGCISSAKHRQVCWLSAIQRILTFCPGQITERGFSRVTLQDRTLITEPVGIFRAYIVCSGWEGQFVTNL